MRWQVCDAHYGPLAGHGKTWNESARFGRIILRGTPISAYRCGESSIICTSARTIARMASSFQPRLEHEENNIATRSSRKYAPSRFSLYGPRIGSLMSRSLCYVSRSHLRRRRIRIRGRSSSNLRRRRYAGPCPVPFTRCTAHSSLSGEQSTLISMRARLTD